MPGLTLSLLPLSLPPAPQPATDPASEVGVTERERGKRGKEDNGAAAVGFLYGQCPRRLPRRRRRPAPPRLRLLPMHVLRSGGAQVQPHPRVGEERGRRRNGRHHRPCPGPSRGRGVRGTSGARARHLPGRRLREHREREGHQRRQLPRLRRDRRDQHQAGGNPRPGEQRPLRGRLDDQGEAQRPVGAGLPPGPRQVHQTLRGRGQRSLAPPPPSPARRSVNSLPFPTVPRPSLLVHLSAQRGREPQKP